MPNTVFGPYAKTSWVNGTTPVNQTNMNNLETQASDALHGFNPDLIGAGFVLSGVTCTKDGTNANQLDIASGVAYVVMSDGTLGRITVVTDNTHTTSALSSTYHLYLQPDGTWYWSTSNSPAANSLFVAQVTTDGSGNILTVTDERTLSLTLLPNLSGSVMVASPHFPIQGRLTSAPGSDTSVITADVVADASTRWNAYIRGSDGYAGIRGGAGGGTFSAHFYAQAGGWQIDEALNVLGVLDAAGGVSNVGGQASAGSFGVPVIVAQALNTHVTTTSDTAILSFTPAANGLYRVNIAGAMSGSGAATLTAYVAYQDPNLAGGINAFALATDGVSTFVLNSAAVTKGRVFSTVGPTIWAASGTAIVVHWHDATTAVSDFVSAFIERLS